MFVATAHITTRTPTRCVLSSEPQPYLQNCTELPAMPGWCRGGGLVPAVNTVASRHRCFCVLGLSHVTLGEVPDTLCWPKGVAWNGWASVFLTVFLLASIHMVSCCLGIISSRTLCILVHRWLCTQVSVLGCGFSAVGLLGKACVWCPALPCTPTTSLWVMWCVGSSNPHTPMARCCVIVSICRWGSRSTER